MAHVITQACCNDAGCTLVCPVDCIHPTPDERTYAASEMLYIDPKTCIDCGSCVPECPVDAIYPDDRLPEHLSIFASVNAEHFAQQPALGAIPARSVLAAPAGAQPLRVAVIGSGPSGCYAALDLLDSVGAGSRVDIYDRLPTPWGLVRYGVAPDHASTKSVTRAFAERARDPRLRFCLNVEVGRHVTPRELSEHYHAVIYAVGATGARALGINGEGLPGSHPASEFVAWYNGHPDFAHRAFDLSGERAVVIGNGNVAIDVARLLVSKPEMLRQSDMPQHAVDALTDSRIREVVVVGRRGPRHAACTTPELMALGRLPGVSVDVQRADLELTADEARRVSRSTSASRKHRLFQQYAESPSDLADRRITFRFFEAPIEILGRDSAEQVVLQRNAMVDGALVPTDVTATLDAGLVLSSVGYRGVALPGLPFDEAKATIPNATGRVLEPVTGAAIRAVYTVGWFKRGPSGVIGTNKQCAHETVTALLEDARAGVLTAPVRSPDDLDRLLAARQPDLVDWDGWRAIDRYEVQAGAIVGRPRLKLTTAEALVSVARTGRQRRSA